MTRPTPAARSLAAALALATAATATAAPPQISGIVPYGVRRGEAAEVTVSGSNLGGNPRLVAPFGFTTAAKGPEGSTAGAWKTRIEVKAETAVGVYPVRVLTDEGLSNPFLFAVGQLPQVAEKEDNSTFEQAQAVEVPAVVEGQAAGNDVDFFRFAGKAGQRVVVDAQCARIGSGVDPSIRLTTAGRKYVASADDTPGLLTDARLVAVLPDDGDYVIELSDSRYQGGGRPIYRLVVGEVPVADEVYPVGGRAGEATALELRGGTLDGVQIAATRPEPMLGVPRAPARVPGAALGLNGPAGRLDVESLLPLVVSDLPEVREAADAVAPPVRAAVPVALNGRIDPAGDEDRFTLAVTPGQRLHIEVEAAEAGSALDGVLQVLNPKGTVLANADDTVAPPRNPQNRQPGPVSPDPSLDLTVPAGVMEITLALRDLGGRGGVGYPYRITAVPTGPTFELSPNDPQVNVPKGGTAAVAVAVVRKGYTGPITLKVFDPPAGLTVRPGTMAAGQLVGAFTVSAAPDAAFGPTTLAVVGEGQGSDGPIVVRATKMLVFAQQATLPTNQMTQVGVAAAAVAPLGVALEAPAEPVEVAHGFGTPVKVKAERGKDATGAVALSPLPLPPGLTVAAATIKEKEAEATVNVGTTTDLPLGDVTFALLAKGKLAGGDRTAAVPAVTLRVVKPADVSLAGKAVEIKPGATAELKGKVTRKGAFKDKVTVKVNGLPAGLKAEPVTVELDATEFTLKLTADAKASPATATANVALTFQVNKKDYPAPPSAPLSVKVVPAK